MLVELLRKLAATGHDGFEGLIAGLLETLTGRQFHLARAGSQAGRDMTADRSGASLIAVECKRYGTATNLDVRELLGELVQAAATIPDLDLWVLVTSRPVDDQLISPLCDEARRRGVEFRAIADSDGAPSTLKALCAQDSERTLGMLAPGLATADLDHLRRELQDISHHTSFRSVVRRLREWFSAPFIGYDQWRTAQQNVFLQRLHDEPESRAAFYQPLNVMAGEGGLVERRVAWTRLDQWLGQWYSTRSILVLTGEEGDGKTWALASWLALGTSERPAFPPVVFVPSPHADTTDPIRLVATELARWHGQPYHEFWCRRIERWLQRPVSEMPMMLLVLDGINERSNFTVWRALLECLRTGPSAERVAVVITCRAQYWERYFAGLDYLNTDSWLLPPYDDSELRIALARRHMSPSQFSAEMLRLLRKPRYLDLAIRYAAQLQASGDFTPARLIFEDWSDRYRRKTRLSLNDFQFQAVLQDLARIRRSGQESLRDSEVRGILRDYEGAYDELCSGGVLIAVGHTRTRYKIDESRLALGLGLLLAEEVERTAAEMGDLDETIAQWLEPHREMDLKARICEMAALSTLQRGASQTVCVALLHAWLECLNCGDRFDETFPPICRYPRRPTWRSPSVSGPTRAITPSDRNF